MPLCAGSAPNRRIWRRSDRRSVESPRTAIELATSSAGFAISSGKRLHEGYLEINEAILEVIALTRSEAVKNGVSVQTQLAEGLPLIQGDRVQLQQVILNLIINAVEAMSGAGEGPRELLISTG